MKKTTWILSLPIIGVILMNLAILPLLLSGETSDGEELPTYDGPSSQTDPTTDLLIAAICFSAVLLFISAVAIVITHNRKTRRNPALERRGMLIIKLGLIPFYIEGGLLCFVFLILPALALLSFLFGIIGWCIMMTGSAWAICYALSLRKMGALTNGKTILVVLMQFIFVLDVISAIIIAIIGRRYEKKKRDIKGDIAVNMGETI